MVTPCVVRRGGILEVGRGQYTKFLPHAFTEQGLAMLSGVLNSDIAIEVNISIMRAFVSLRQVAAIVKQSDLIEMRKEILIYIDDILADQNDINESTRAQGCRAALKLLRRYYDTHKRTTISKIIRRWAPETENQTEAYIKTVSRLTGIAPTTPLPPMKEETKTIWCDLVVAMASVECGLDQKGREQLAVHVDIGWRLLNP